MHTAITAVSVVWTYRDNRFSSVYYPSYMKQLLIIIIII